METTSSRWTGKPTNLDTRKPATSEIPLPGPEVFHNYLTELYVARDRTLGMFQLNPGRHILTFIVTGKDPHSVGYNLGINDVVLEKVQEANEVRDIREAMPGETVGVVYRGRRAERLCCEAANSFENERPILIRAIGSFGADGRQCLSAINRCAFRLVASCSRGRGRSARAGRSTQLD